MSMLPFIGVFNVLLALVFALGGTVLLVLAIWALLIYIRKNR
ncbi:hypothetical protein [Allofournierella sp.]